MGKTKLKHGDNKGKKGEVIDEWEIADIDRDEQKRGIERREKRIRDNKLEEIRQNKLRHLAVKKAEQMEDPKHRPPNDLEKAWLMCDYILWNVMEKKAYEFMEWQRLNDPEAYKALYRIFISPYMMEYAEWYVNYFGNGGVSSSKITWAMVVKEYKKIKGIKSKIVIKRKNEEDKEL